jgi:PHD/YefM family antitoxin component YafN of YafNO toxin-antitoxin module
MNSKEMPMQRWPVQLAKMRLSEMLEACITEGPQLLTRDGIDKAVLLRIDDWQRLQPDERLTLKQLLLVELPRFDSVLPAKGKARRRATVPAR